MNNVIVSVCMSTYNEELSWLEKAIDSILNQTYEKFEFLIVLDNPDNHEIYNLLKSYERKDQRVQIIVNESNKGLVFSLNKIISLAKGTYIMRMDADDISALNRIEMSLKTIQKSNADFIITDAIEINEAGEKTGYKSVDGAGRAKSHYYGMVSIHPTWFVKKTVYDELNGYRNIKYAEDYDFLVRAILKGKKIATISQPLLEYRMRSNSISRSKSLDQFIISQKISKEFRKSTKNLEQDFPKIDDEVLVTEKDRDNYAVGLKLFNDAIIELKHRKYIKAMTGLFESSRQSKYIVKKILNVIWFKTSQLVSEKKENKNE